MAIHDDDNEQRALCVPTEKRDVPQKYLFRKCEHRECTVMIGWQVGAMQGQTECKWCQNRVSHWQLERLV
jgi:hypothetical protein